MAKSTTAATKATPRKSKTPKPEVEMPAVPTALMPDPAVVEPAEAVVAKPALRKSELVEAIALRTGHKPRDIKPVMEALLAVMGEAVADGQELNLPPFGKLRLQRVKDTDKARITVAKLRQSK